MEDKKAGVVLNGLDLSDLALFISEKRNRYLAIILQELEESIGKDHPKWPLVRKSVLDGLNSYSRSLAGFFFGDIENESNQNFRPNKQP